MDDRFPPAPLRTIPLYDHTGTDCDCSNPQCLAAGKHPITYGRNAKPGERFGVRTGSGMLVLDLDLKGRSLPKVLALVEDKLGPLPDTYTVETPSGGLHLYFLTDTPCTNKQGLFGKDSGVDVRGEGGFVVAASMSHRNGGTYTVADDLPLAYAPESLIILCRKPLGIEAAKVTDRIAYEAGSEMEAKAIVNYRKYLDAEPDGQAGEGRDAQLWMISLRAAALSLPPQTSLPLIQQHWNGRGRPTPVPEDVIIRKLGMAWQSPHVQAIPLELTDLFGKEKKEGAEVFEIPPFLPPRKRAKSPEHVYSFNPTMSATKEPAEIGLSALVQVFALRDDWGGCLSWDTREDRLVCIDPPLALQCESRANGFTEQDIFRLKAWLNAMGSDASPKIIENAFLMAAQMQPFEPVKAYLEALEPMDQDAAQAFIAKTARDWFNPEITPIEIDFFQKWLIAAVRRGLKPGTEVQTVLVLYGAQGEGKSALGKVLFRVGNQSFFSDQMPERVDGRDASHALRGKWCVEFAELEALLKNELATKAFLGRDEDKYRGYGHGTEIVSPRACVFLGTTNEKEFLSDHTGNRRYWPIEVTKKTSRFEYAMRRDALWQAAYSLAIDDAVPHYFENEKSDELDAARAGYFQGDAWSDLIVAYCKGKDSVRIIDIWEKAIFGQGMEKGAYEKFDKGKQNKIGRILKSLGCTSIVVGSRYDRQRVWKVCDELREATLTPEEKARAEAERKADKVKADIKVMQSIS